MFIWFEVRYHSLVDIQGVFFSVKVIVIGGTLYMCGHFIQFRNVHDIVSCLVVNLEFYGDPNKERIIRMTYLECFFFSFHPYSHWSRVSVARALSFVCQLSIWLTWFHGTENTSSGTIILYL